MTALPMVLMTESEGTPRPYPWGPVEVGNVNEKTL